MKTSHERAMKLVEYLARDAEYWAQIAERKRPSPPQTSISDTHNNSDKTPKESPEMQWDQSPLMLAAKVSLYNVVERILKVYPQSAMYLNPEGRNVLQVVIQNRKEKMSMDHRKEKIIDIVESMSTGPTLVLPYGLLFLSIDKETKNTILHFAAKVPGDQGEHEALRMQRDCTRFTKIHNLVPSDIKLLINGKKKSAYDLFFENHKDMIKNSKNQLVSMGQTGSGLATGMIFALASFSFSVPRQQGHRHPAPGDLQDLHPRLGDYSFFCGHLPRALHGSRCLFVHTVRLEPFAPNKVLLCQLLLLLVTGGAALGLLMQHLS